MSPKDLKQRTLTGFKWSFVDNVGKATGQFVFGIILTRLLTPADFGLVGMITIFIVIGQSLTNSGFGQALIQKKILIIQTFQQFFTLIFLPVFFYIFLFSHLHH
jgi:teichuronic acid exporter